MRQLIAGLLIMAARCGLDRVFEQLNQGTLTAAHDFSCCTECAHAMVDAHSTPRLEGLRLLSRTGDLSTS